MKTKFLRRTGGYKIINHNGIFESRASRRDTKTIQSNCLQCVTTMNNNNTQKIILNYRPNGSRRSVPLNRLLDEAETSLLRSKS